MINTVAAEWSQFEAMVVAPSAGAVQREQMELAFYGGASAVLAMYHRIAGEASEDAAVGILQGLHEEVSAYAARVRPR